jgi:uncharacterized protein YidB (DUF937 family)
MALGDILSKLGGQQGQQGGLAAITRLLGGGNGLQGIMSKLHANGMGEQVKSWVSTGQNMPVSGADIKHVVDQQQLAQLAEQRGMSPDQMADQVAQALPGVVDKATPEGQVPQQGSSMDSLMGILK